MVQHPDGRRTVIPVHAGETIRPRTLLAILQDVQMDVSEFSELF